MGFKSIEIQDKVKQHFRNIIYGVLLMYLMKFTIQVQVKHSFETKQSVSFNVKDLRR